MHSISLIVATKDRPDDLRRLLESLHCQTAIPTEVVVVDASSEPVELVVAEFPQFVVRYLRHWPPSAAAQRNAGIRASRSHATLICFADDDTTFEPNAFANMLRFWEEAEPDVLGAAFNIRNYPARKNVFLKHSTLAERLGLYYRKPGSVAPSGWQTIIGELDNTQFVDWLPSTAVVFRREIFAQNMFDEFFESYSYLEDLDFSYSVSRKGRLAVVADAGYSHLPSTAGRVSARQFGRFEVCNRLHFVRKHQLSGIRCHIGLTIRMALTTYSVFKHRNRDVFQRLVGNVKGLTIDCFQRL